MKLFAVIIKLPNGSEGYHSVWDSEQKAQRQLAVRQRAVTHYNYYVKEVEPIAVDGVWWLRGQVKLVSSVGWLPVY